MLAELKEKALEAEQKFHTVEVCLLEWEKVIDHSERLAIALQLDLSKGNKSFASKVLKLHEDIERNYKVLEASRDNVVFEYALAVLGGKKGDLIDYIDLKGRSRTLIIESAQLIGNSIAIFGKRYLTSGKVGTHIDYVCLETVKWKLR